jgi:cGMP-dependent protein kinase
MDGKGSAAGGARPSSGSTKSRNRQNIYSASFETYGVDEAKTYYPKTRDTKRVLVGALQDHYLFNSLAPSDVTDVMNAMQRQMVHSGDLIIQQGDPGNKFYVLEEGASEVLVDGNVVGAIGPGGAFGELALMYNCPRAATIRATSMCTVWTLGRLTFRRLLATTASSAIAERCAFLKKVPQLNELSNNNINSIAGAMENKTFRMGDNIIEQGEPGDAFYVLKDGKCSAFQSKQAGDPAVKVGDLVAGDFFGETALLTNEPRNATVTVLSQMAEVLVLSKTDFEIILGPLGEALIDVSRMRELASADAHATSGIGGGAAKVAGDQRRASQGDLSILMQDLDMMVTLGTGTFGRVKMCEHRPTGRMMALKAMMKSQIVKSHQEKNVVAEKDILLECDHPFIIKLYRTFQDTNSIFMLLELVLGGELWTLLYQNVDAIPRTNLGGYAAGPAQFYSACVISCFKHVHSLGVAYRDLKPENLLLGRNGYLKMVDFGFAKKIPYYKGRVLQNKSFTLCGTPEYLSPELVLSQGHNQGVDWWYVFFPAFSFSFSWGKVVGGGGLFTSCFFLFFFLRPIFLLPILRLLSSQSVVIPRGKPLS